MVAAVPILLQNFYGSQKGWGYVRWLPQLLERNQERVCALDDELGQSNGVIRSIDDLEGAQASRCAVNQVNRFAQPVGQFVDVLTIKGCNEGRSKPIEQCMGITSRRFINRLQLSHPPGQSIWLAQQIVQHTRGRLEMVPEHHEVVDECLIERNDAHGLPFDLCRGWFASILQVGRELVR